MHQKRTPPHWRSATARTSGSIVATLAVTAVLIAALPVSPVGLGLAVAGAPSKTATSVQPSTAQAVLDRVREAVRAIRDASARLTIESVDERGRRTRSVIDAALIRRPAVVRLVILEPSALADQVYVIDFQARKAQVYLPVTHQILVQPLDRLMPAEAGATAGVNALALSPERLFEVLPAGSADASIRLVGTEKAGTKTLYVLEAPVARSSPQGTSASLPSPAAPGLTGLLPINAGASAEAAFVRVWIDGATWLAAQAAVYGSANKELATLTFADVRINRDLRPEALRQLPADAEVVEG